MTVGSDDAGGTVMAIDLLKLFLFTTLRVPNSGTIHGSFAITKRVPNVCRGCAFACSYSRHAIDQLTVSLPRLGFLAR